MTYDMQPHKEKQRGIRNAAVFMAVFLFGLWGGSGYWAWSSRQETLASTESSLLELSHAVEKYVRNVIKMAEIFQASAEHWLEVNDSVDPCTNPEFRALLADFQRRTDGLIDVRLVRSDGGMFCLPGYPGQSLDSAADSEYFEAVRHSLPGELYLGVPFIDRLSGKHRLPIVMRMARSHHDFIMICASVDLDAMIATFDSERPKPGGIISLWRNDGVLLARSPDTVRLVGRQLAPDDLLYLNTPSYASRIFLRSTPIDGVERLVSHRSVGNTAVAVVGAAREDVLKLWERQVLLTFLALTGVTLWGTLLFRQLVGVLRRLEENAHELERLATTDTLTGLYNRRYLMDVGVHELSRARRYSNSMALMLIDIDHFKRVNDTWGHPMGDQVLQALSEAMNSTIRNQDTLGRLGGEEFVAILPETDRAGAATIAERILSAAREKVLLTTESGDLVKITVSIGITTLDLAEDSFGAALTRVDKALYRAKEKGRDRVEID